MKRSPLGRRPLAAPPRHEPSAADLAAAAERVRYVSSPMHKFAKPTELGPGRPALEVFSLTPRWMASDLEDPAEAATFAEVALSVEGESLAQLEDPDTGTQYAGAFLPALPLALGLAQRWWRLLYEPEKRSDRRVEARHRLDVLCLGYVFPPLALWSGGDVVMARLLTPDLRFQRQRFVAPERAEPWYLPRQAVEKSLAGFVEAVLSRLPASCGEELREVWQRVTASRADPEEAAWCMAAGRLGFDPYDAATPDLE